MTARPPRALSRLRLAFTPKSALRRPAQLVLFVTDRCNARCRHCFHWEALNHGADLLSHAELEDLQRELGPLLTVSLSGGEPFLRSDLARLVGLFEDSGEVSIPTNGLRTERIVESVSRMLDEGGPPLVVLLSVDGLRETHDRIRGVDGNFDRLQETCRALAELKRRASRRELRLKVGTVLCNLNVAEIPALSESVRCGMPDVDFHNFEILRGAPPDGTIHPPTVAELEWVKPHVFAAWERSMFFGRSRRVSSWLAVGLKRFLFELYIETLRQKRQLIPCLAGRTSAVVDETGNLSFCELREPIGNLREERFETLWTSPRADRIRASIARGECHCVHSCFQPKNVVLNPRLWPHVARYLATGAFTLPATPQGTEAATRKPT